MRPAVLAHPYLQLVLQTQPWAMFDASLPDDADTAVKTALPSLGCRRDAAGAAITASWSGTPIVSNTRPPVGLPRTTAPHPNGAGATNGALDLVNVHSPGGGNGWAAAGWIFRDNSNKRGSLLKIGAAANGFALGLGATNHETDGDKLIALFEGVRWIASSWIIPANVWSYIALWVPAGSSTCYLFGNGALRLESGGAAMAAPTASGHAFKSNVANRALSIAALWPVVWHSSHSKLPWSATTAARDAVGLIFAEHYYAGITGNFPRPRRPLLG